jgi:hypothetical protein
VTTWRRGDVATQNSAARSTEQLSRAEVFGAEDVELFDRYFQTDDIPASSALRPVEGWAADRSYIAPAGT